MLLFTPLHRAFLRGLILIHGASHAQVLRFPSNKPMDHFHNPFLGFKPQTSPSHPKLERGFGSYNYLGFSFRNSEHVNFKK